MAKVSTATIRLVQKLNRKNKNGEYPLYIVVCYGGRIEKATKISCLPKFWDSKREIIKNGCPNAPVLNKMLNGIKNRLIEARNAFEYEGRVYTPSMLFDAVRKPQNKLTNDFKSLYERLVDEDKMVKQSGSFGVIALKWVRKAFEEINESIIQYNVDNDAHEPLIEVERVDMYTARHSFANHYLNSPNATVSGLASLLSRSPNTIATYVHQLTKDEEIASMVEGMVI